MQLFIDHDRFANNTALPSETFFPETVADHRNRIVPFHRFCCGEATTNRWMDSQSLEKSWCHAEPESPHRLPYTTGELFLYHKSLVDEHRRALHSPVLIAHIREIQIGNL